MNETAEEPNGRRFLDRMKKKMKHLLETPQDDEANFWKIVNTEFAMYFSNTAACRIHLLMTEPPPRSPSRASAPLETVRL